MVRKRAEKRLGKKIYSLDKKEILVISRKTGNITMIQLNTNIQ